MATAPVRALVPAAVPTKQAVLGAEPSIAKQPPAAVQTRAVVARSAPPPPPPRLNGARRRLPAMPGSHCRLRRPSRFSRAVSATDAAAVRIAPPATRISRRNRPPDQPRQSPSRRVRTVRRQPRLSRRNRPPDQPRQSPSRRVRTVRRRGRQWRTPVRAHRRPYTRASFPCLPGRLPPASRTQYSSVSIFRSSSSCTCAPGAAATTGAAAAGARASAACQGTGGRGEASTA